MSETSVERAIAPKQLTALIADATQKRERMQSIAGELGERVKAAVENGGLHRGAFGVMCRLHKMPEDRRNDFVRSLELYLDICERDMWGGQHMGDLVDDAEADAAAEQAAVDEQMRVNGERAAGFKQLDPEKGDGKPKRGRPKKAAAEAEEPVEPKAPIDPFQAYRQRGAAAFRARIGGVIPDDLAGDKGKGEAWLDGWREEQAKATARSNGDSFEDDAESDRPSRIQNERRNGLSGATAAGSTVVQ